ncbi:MAG: ATP-dependent DNA ligase [Patescibacteria group bacterium]
MTFNDFALLLEELEKTPSRLEMTALLAQLFSRLEKEEIAPTCYLLQGRLVPQYQSLEFQLSSKMLVRVLARIKADLTDSRADNFGGAVGDSQTKAPASKAVSLDLFNQPDYSSLEKAVDSEYRQIGDLGLLAEKIINQFRAQSSVLSPRLDNVDISQTGGGQTILQVFDSLQQVAKQGGEGSQDRKVNQMVELLRKNDPVAAKFIVRIILGKLRLGFSTMTMMDALSWQRRGDKSDSGLLEETYQKRADIGQLAEVYLTAEGEEGLKRALEQYSVKVGVPVVPSLCQRLNSATEIIEKLGQVIAEPKYDGLRVQIHLSKEACYAFTRNLEDVTHMFPEIQKMLQVLSAQSCILDAEAIGFSLESGKLLTFQETITRKRKHDIEQQAQKVPIRFYIFDVLSLNGQSLIDLPLFERKQKLARLFTDNDFMVKAPFVETNSATELKQFHEEQLALGLEGAVMKKANSKYRSGRKGWRWVKIKEEEGSRGKLNDTLDCLVMGYYFGRGKRTQFGIGAFLVGVLGGGGENATELRHPKTTDKSDESILAEEAYDQSQKVLTIAKIGTGLTDEQFLEFKKRVAGNEMIDKPVVYEVEKNLMPDKWISPFLVVEIAADEITKSPVHTAGVALRFPRLVRFRDDKSWEETTTLDEVRTIEIAK